jgi:hypothetical protein
VTESVARYVLAYSGMRLARRCIALGFASISVIAAVSCGRDFDSLFVDGPAEAGVGTDGGPNIDGGDGSVPVKNDGGTEAGPTTCTGASVCKSDDGCDAGTNACFTLCSGCQGGIPCECATQDCPPADGNNSCQSTCSEGAVCDVACKVTGPCNLSCSGCTSSKLDCQSGTTNCTTTCSAGSSCQQTCTSKTASCSMICPAGAKCVLRCAAGTTGACSLDCEDGQKTTCPNGVSTCNQACPN